MNTIKLVIQSIKNKKIFDSKYIFYIYCICQKYEYEIAFYLMKIHLDIDLSIEQNIFINTNKNLYNNKEDLSFKKYVKKTIGLLSEYPRSRNISNTLRQNINNKFHDKFNYNNGLIVKKLNKRLFLKGRTYYTIYFKDQKFVFCQQDELNNNELLHQLNDYEYKQHSFYENKFLEMRNLFTNYLTKRVFNQVIKFCRNYLKNESIEQYISKLQFEIPKIGNKIKKTDLEYNFVAYNNTYNLLCIESCDEIIITISKINNKL